MHTDCYAYQRIQILTVQDILDGKLFLAPKVQARGDGQVRAIKAW